MALALLVIFKLHAFVDLSHKETQETTGLLATGADTHSTHVLVAFATIRVSIVVLRLSDERPVSFPDFVGQLRLFLRVVVFVERSHGSPGKDVLHCLLLIFGLCSKRGKRLQEFDLVVIHVAEPGILCGNDVNAAVFVHSNTKPIQN